MRHGRELAALILALGLGIGLVTAQAEPRFYFGEESGTVWVEVGVSDPATGFRLAAANGSGGGLQLLLPEVPQTEERSVDAGLPHLESFRVEPASGGRGTIVSLPFALGSLAAVDRVEGGGWRFTFDVGDAPAGAAAAAGGEGEYVLGIRDVVEITVFGHEDLSKKIEVPADRFIDFPLIGRLEVAGRTVDSLQEELTRRLGKDYLVEPNVGVRVSEYQSQWVNIVGRVREPGKYYLRGTSTLIDMITEAGGLEKEAGTDIVITRNEMGRMRQIHVDRADLFSEDNEEFNIPLLMGDVVEVAEREMFYIQGEIARPGTYPLEPGYTVLKAITVAGGFSQWADRKQVELLREEGGERTKIRVNLKAISGRKKPDLELLPEDIIIVKRRLL